MYSEVKFISEEAKQEFYNSTIQKNNERSKFDEIFNVATVLQQRMQMGESLIDSIIDITKYYDLSNTTINFLENQWLYNEEFKLAMAEKMRFSSAHNYELWRKEAEKNTYLKDVYTQIEFACCWMQLKIREGNKLSNLMVQVRQEFFEELADFCDMEKICQHISFYWIYGQDFMAEYKKGVA